jgi:hypothetical protein
MAITIFVRGVVVAILKSQVFLVQGRKVGNEADRTQAGIIQQKVVVARNDQSVMRYIEHLDDEFKVVGFATLWEYEQTVAKIHATLNQQDTDWELLVEDGMS